jgi:hypothetical protein
MMRKVWMSLLVVVGITVQAPAAVFHFDFDPEVRVYNSGVFPLFNDGTYSFDAFDDPENGTFADFGGPVVLDVIEVGQGLFWNADGAGGYSYAGSGGTATEFTAGQVISTGGTTWQDANVLLSQSISSTTYYGIRDDSNNVGWIQIRRDATQDYSIVGLAYSDTGTIEAGQITAGSGTSAVPEPGTMVLMMSGTGLLLMMRRKMRGA